MVAGRYRLVESIGQGGMGRVWRAVDEILDRLVAVKEMRIDGLDAEDSRTRRERTLREARATARIDHPNVVRVYDVVDEGERLWIVMELVAGRSLERILAERGSLSPGETARIGLGLVAALRQVHERGVLHRDIKPGNVLVEHADGVAGSGRGNGSGSGPGRRVVLTDFGIAAIQDAKALTMVGMLVGSPDYMAPERISGRPQGPPSDLWSLGATLCAALGGRSPFSRDTTLATLHAVLYEEPELPAASGPLRDILTSLLAKEPSARPDLETLQTALEPVGFPASIPTVADEERSPRPDPAPDLPTTLGGQRAAPEPQPQATSPAPPPAPAPDPAPLLPAPRDPRSPAPVPEPHHHPHPAPTTTSANSQTPVSLTRAQAETECRPQPTPQPMPPGELPGPPTPAAPRRHPGRRTALTVAAATLAAAGTVAAILLATSAGPPGDGDETPRAGSSASAPATTSDTTGNTSGATTADTTPSPTVEGTARPQTLPPGTHREAGGFAWATPDGWRRDVKTGAEVHYTSPDGSQELVGKSSLARGDLLETWQTSERNAQQGQDYRKIRLEETTFRGHPAVVWEYTFTLKGVHWHARLLGFDVTGKSYQVNTWYEAGIEQEALATYEKVRNSFTVL
ncbi:serine/threonine protein kinase [Streptomyces sp. NRRL B-1140]|uniref:serine/threonine-protein kinase n=1 Tax=Streptomyces sp. NRRL B-1140 TaxID=1415549 RepID=UPI0006C29219|nr:serine/threonine-protein kinase [Streptomyces sp. NRRL B-1140]KOV98769.1 serine/threonine protein kinase [Streptomyces sp. NRRL B-1140]